MLQWLIVVCPRARGPSSVAPAGRRRRPTEALAIAVVSTRMRPTCLPSTPSSPPAPARPSLAPRPSPSPVSWGEEPSTPCNGGGTGVVDGDGVAGALSSEPVRRPRRPRRPARTSAVVSHGRGPSNAPGAAAREAEDGRLQRGDGHGVGQRRGERERAGDGRGQFYLGFRPQLATFVDQPLPRCTKNARSLLNDSRHPNGWPVPTLHED